MSWVAVAIGAGTLIAGTGSYLGATNSPTVGQRNFGNELSGINGQYNNTLNTFLGGNSSFNQQNLGNLGVLTGGAFDANKWFADHPGEQDNYNAMKASGELTSGWTPEMYAKQFMGGDNPSTQDQAKYNSYRSGGLLPLQNQLNTQTRASNLADVAMLGGTYTDIMHGANKDYYSALNSFTSKAGAPVQMGTAQQAGMNQALGGFGTFDPSGLYANTKFSSQTVDPMMIGADRVQAPGSMLNVQAPGGNPLLSSLNMQAFNQGPSQLQQQQNGIASQALANGGNLSPSELRNVQQSSRAGFAARGLDATNASVVDEAMQTDAASRARLMQNVGLAQGVQNQGMAEHGQQQQFGLGVAGQNYGYGQLGLQGQIANQGTFQNLNSLNLQGQLANQSAGLEASRSNQGAGLTAQQSNQGANLQAQQYGLQGQMANQQFGLGSFNANLSSQQAQQQALQQQAMLQEQQRQFGLNSQLSAVNAQRQGYLDPYSAIMGGNDPGLLGSIMGQNQANMSTQQNLFNGLMSYGQDLNNTNYNATQAANIARYNGQQGIYGGMINLGGQLIGAGMGGCWVAREVYGTTDDRWTIFRHWLFTRAPQWFRSLYLARGEKFAAWLHDHPAFKPAIRRWMDSRIATLNQV